MRALINGTRHTRNEQMSKLINGMRQMEPTNNELLTKQDKLNQQTHKLINEMRRQQNERICSLINGMSYPIDEHKMHLLKNLSCLGWLLYKQTGSNSIC